jgi:hypothetical protein
MNKYLKELLVIKCAIDFKINFHLATSRVGQTSSTKKLIFDLIPFAIDFHSAMTDLGYEKFQKFSVSSIDQHLFNQTPLSLQSKKKDPLHQWGKERLQKLLHL